MINLAPIDLSIIIITKNEEKRLSKCIASLPEGAEIIVVDSGSSDRTQEIARDSGALVLERVFDNYASQKNFALSKASREWVLSIDADEILNPALRTEIIEKTKCDSAEHDVYRVKRQLVFQGRAMRFGKTIDYPHRLFKRNSASFSGAVHEKLVGNNLRIARLTEGVLLHFSYENLEDYFLRFNRYTTMVAGENYRKKRKLRILDPMRFWVEFLVRYFIRLGFLDGYPGYCYALVSSFYGFIKHAKLREIYERTASDAS